MLPDERFRRILEIIRKKTVGHSAGTGKTDRDI